MYSSANKKRFTSKMHVGDIPEKHRVLLLELDLPEDFKHILWDATGDHRTEFEETFKKLALLVRRRDASGDPIKTNPIY
jgi:hypothetical protein